ncbi:NADP-dependent oxidoreductase [Micromonospora sp. WMMD1102]|uniref:NADP-dependent oxidoreductase n=1 Tax=Micromonospora sp. WMMD1102 TaxID=3016105 RepID=UPI0024154B02|nr:NADP-dependent oxidoreductase [Micromonospora sp. WMMD1102]MDG4784753.1 NADP-dependent oxidoreductase [Micromonospora sp. WMMD1102]
MRTERSMRAARIHRYGDASVIRHDEVPRPVPGDGEVLVEVAATSFNPSEVGLRAGLLRSLFALELPYTLGWDVAGTVVEVGGGVRTWTVGDRMVGRVDTGGAADYVVAAAGTVVPAPRTVPLAHAAALPVAGLTAWQAVYEQARLTSGQRVLVNGAGGGVGGFAVQLARYTGATVIATASRRSAGTLRRLGADQIVDYTATSLVEALDEPVDALLNLVPLDPRQAGALLPLVRPGGILVSATVPVPAPAGSAVRTTRFVARNDPDQLAGLVELVDAGVVRLDIAGFRPLAELAELHREAEAGRIRGKTILIPAGVTADAPH